MQFLAIFLQQDAFDSKLFPIHIVTQIILCRSISKNINLKIYNLKSYSVSDFLLVYAIAIHIHLFRS